MKRKKVIIKHFDIDNYVAEDVSHSNSEIETKLYWTVNEYH